MAEQDQETQQKPKRRGLRVLAVACIVLVAALVLVAAAPMLLPDAWLGRIVARQLGKALGRDYALAELRLVFGDEDDPEEKARLALLAEILTSVPLTARAHRELNSLRRSKITGQALVAQLLRIVRDYNLEEAHSTIADQAEEAPLIPRIVCSEVLGE